MPLREVQPVLIIDSHVHVWSADVATYPFRPILPHVPAPSEPAPGEILLQEMDKAGVDISVLVQPSVYGWDNRYLMECLRRYPERFAGICAIDPEMARPSDLDLWCAAGGCRGLRFNIIGQPDMSWLLDARRRRLFDAAEARGLSVSFHMNVQQATILAALAERHSGMVFIVDYLGVDVMRDPNADDHLDRLAAQTNIFIKLLCSATDARTDYPFPDLRRFVLSNLERFGPERSMFGSDYPDVRSACPYRKAVEWAREVLGSDSRSANLMLGDVAATVFGINRH